MIPISSLKADIMAWYNKIYCGDCKDVLLNLPKNSVDLIYLDPPFNANRFFNVIWNDRFERDSFKDRWKGGIDTFVEWMKRYYGVDEKTIYESLVNCGTYKSHKGPDSMMHRYVHEDVPNCMVPIASLGDALKVETPALDTMINLAGLINGTDYWREGRTLEKVGLAGLGAIEMMNYVS